MGLEPTLSSLEDWCANQLRFADKNGATRFDETSFEFQSKFHVVPSAFATKLRQIKRQISKSKGQKGSTYFQKKKNIFRPFDF